MMRRMIILPIEDADYFIKMIPFPIPVPAFIHLNSDGTYVIFLNSNLDFEHQLDGLEHEYWHILHDDFYGENDIRKIEKQYQ